MMIKIYNILFVFESWTLSYFIKRSSCSLFTCRSFLFQYFASNPSNTSSIKISRTFKLVGYIFLLLCIAVNAIATSNLTASGINIDSLTAQQSQVAKVCHNRSQSGNSLDILSKQIHKNVRRRYAKRHSHYKTTKYPSQMPLGKMQFDFIYSGDILGLTDELHSYDSNLVILPILGKRQDLAVNIDLQNVTVADISDAISSQTGDRVHLLYDNVADTIRLSFTSIMDVGRDAVDESLKWQHGTTPRPVLKADGVVRFPYGEYQPIVICQPLNLCDIELQAGEAVQGIVIGDSLRWNEGDKGIPVVYSGSHDNLTPHLVLKPSQGGLETSLMVTTSRRTYMFKLKSAMNGYVARVGFYYPDEMIERFESNKALLRDAYNASGIKSMNMSGNTTSSMTMPLVNLANINYHYEIVGADYDWKPTQVFDDGVSVYIQLPPDIGSRNLPGLCVTVPGKDSHDECEMVNFRYNDHFYIVDELFDEAKLINGFGNNMQTITIKRKRVKTGGFWSHVF